MKIDISKNKLECSWRELASDKDITIKYLEKMLDKMYEIEDTNYVLDCWSTRLSKDMKTIEKAIEIIKEWDEQYV